MCQSSKVERQSVVCADLRGSQTHKKTARGQTGQRQVRRADLSMYDSVSAVSQEGPRRVTADPLRLFKHSLSLTGLDVVAA